MEEAALDVFFSIVIPAFNAGKYIEQCINSVLAQTFKSFEVIIIDDESNDNTSEVCFKIVSSYRCVLYEKIKHSGAGAARNLGLQKAKGEFVIFLDADDYWMNERLLEQLYNKVSETPVDVVMFQMDKCTENGKILKRYRKAAFPMGKNSYQLSEVYSVLVRDGQVLASSCNKCVSRSLLNSVHIEFQEGGLAEDIDWSLQLFSSVKTISFLNEISYAYRQHKSESVSRNKKGPEYQARMIQDWTAKIEQRIIAETNAVSGLLAFEYGICLGYWHYLSPEMRKVIKEHQYLLNEALDRKTLMIKRFRKVFGFKLTCLAIRFYLFCRRLW